MERLAVIGTGIAGMAAAWFLHRRFDLTVYERKEYIGGHTNTIGVQEGPREVPVDTGFIVYNETTYPNLVQLFQTIGAPTVPTTMSFSFQHQGDDIEYGGATLNQVFGQRRNLLRPLFWGLLGEINRFFRDSQQVLHNENQWLDKTVSDFANQGGYSANFLRYYLLPMSSAIWSSPLEAMLQFPIVSLVRFFSNHGLLGMSGHLQWHTVKGGSREYRRRLVAPFRERIRVNAEVIAVERRSDGVAVTSQGQTDIYDRVVIAGHADQALDMLVAPTADEERLLSAYTYQSNKVQLHTDPAAMPRRRRVWSAWNYRLIRQEGDRARTSTTYWMNCLQPLDTETDYFVSVNDPGQIDPSRIIKEIAYDHPLFDQRAIRLQSELPGLNQNGRLYYCGSYFKYGFHEDALCSAIDVCQRILDTNDIWALAS